MSSAEQNRTQQGFQPKEKQYYNYIANQIFIVLLFEIKSKIKFNSITFLALKNSLFKVNTGSKITQIRFLHNPLWCRD